MTNIITKDNVKISICFSLIIIVPIVITITSSSVMLITFTLCHLYPSDFHLVLPSSQLCKKIKGKKWILIHQPSACRSLNILFCYIENGMQNKREKRSLLRTKASKNKTLAKRNVKHLWKCRLKYIILYYFIRYVFYPAN